MRALVSITLGVVFVLSGCIYSIDSSLIEPDQGIVDVPSVDLEVDQFVGDITCDGCATDILGRLCGASNPCPLGLHCAYPVGGLKGYCTFTCEAQGVICEGAAQGTLFACALPTKDQEIFCVFLCATAAASYPCPNGLVCALEESPAGSGQRICVPQ
ncbi:MAG: hypothetical protein JRH20_05650 [Deltaproteobacteria bacterium]|nr:hypothetical protein [Deltaproteobacteria bacterium]